MESTTVKTFDELAQATGRTAHDAAEAAIGYAREAKAIAGHAYESIRPDVRDAKTTAREAVGTAKSLAGDAKAIAGDAVDTGRAAAWEKVDAARRKIEDLKQQAQHAKEAGARRVAEAPGRSLMVAALAGAVLAALAVSLSRRRA